MTLQWLPYLEILCSFLFDDAALLYFLRCVHFPGLLCLINNRDSSVTIGDRYIS